MTVPLTIQFPTLCSPLTRGPGSRTLLNAFKASCQKNNTKSAVSEPYKTSRSTAVSSFKANETWRFCQIDRCFLALDPDAGQMKWLPITSGCFLSCDTSSRRIRCLDAAEIKRAFRPVRQNHPKVGRLTFSRGAEFRNVRVRQLPPKQRSCIFRRVYATFNKHVALVMQKQTRFDWKAIRRHFADCECLHIVNNSLLLMYESPIVFRGKEQTLRAKMAERVGQSLLFKVQN